MELGLRGTVAIVTGGASGIGAGIVESLAREGVSVVIADLILDAAEQLAAKVRKNGARALAVKTDVSKKVDAENLAARTIQEFGKIDILVNNAGVVVDARLIDTEEEEWDRVHRINVKGTYLVTRAVVPHMMSARRGKIVNISSRAGREGQVLLSCYSASKFAVIGLTQSLAKELAEYDINVNAICPGVLRTSMMEFRLDSRTKLQCLPREEIFKKLVEPIPLKRPQTPEDIANAVLFLCSDISKNITGESLNVNGGLRMD